MTNLVLKAQVFPVSNIVNNGADEKRINFVFVGDGYTNGEIVDYNSDVADVTNIFFNESPFMEYADFFNVYAIDVVSNQSGANHPGTATDVSEPVIPVATIDNYFGSAFDVGNIHRLLVPQDYTALFNVLNTNFPAYDQALILVNSTEYGGSGGTFATSSINNSAPQIMVHEVGHSFANLADEYWNGIIAAEHINMTAESDPTIAKWSEWVGISGTGVYPYGSSSPQSNWYRPHQNCYMRYLGSPFCPVCKEGIIEKIYSLVTPIDNFAPTNTNQNFSGVPLDFVLDLIYPNPNTLEIEWVLNGTIVANDVAMLNLGAADLTMTTNTLVAKVYDATPLSKVYLPATGYEFSVTWTITNEQTLPIDLLAFEALANNQKVDLKWDYTTDVLVKEFIIERSEDGVKFDEIGSTLNNYFVDIRPLSGLSYYRLKVVDQNEIVTLSDVRSVNRIEKFSFNIFPNPAQDFIQMSYKNNTAGKSVVLSVSDVNGKKVLEQDVNLEKGSNLVQMDISALSAGNYFFNLNNGSKVERFQFVKM